jgi:hypothetical protein
VNHDVRIVGICCLPCQLFLTAHSLWRDIPALDAAPVSALLAVITHYKRRGTKLLLFCKKKRRLASRGQMKTIEWKSNAVPGIGAALLRHSY